MSSIGPSPLVPQIGFAAIGWSSDGSPTFLINVGGVSVADVRCFGVWLRRTLTWDVAAGPEATWTHPAGSIVSEGKGSEPGKRIFVYTWLP